MPKKSDSLHLFLRLCSSACGSVMAESSRSPWPWMDMDDGWMFMCHANINSHFKRHFAWIIVLLHHDLIRVRQQKIMLKSNYCWWIITAQLQFNQSTGHLYTVEVYFGYNRTENTFFFLDVLFSIIEGWLMNKHLWIKQERFILTSIFLP